MRTIINTLSNGLFASVAFAAVAERQRILPDVSKEKPNKAEPKETMDDMAARCDKQRAHVVKTSHSHAKDLHEATVTAFMFAAIHGQPGKLTALWKEVSAIDQAAIRVFVVNSGKKYGKSIEGRPVHFLTYSQEKGFTNAKYEEGTQKYDFARDFKRLVQEKGEDTIRATVPMGSERANSDAMSRVFDVADTTQRFLKTLARNGELPFAKEVNRLLDNTMALTDGELEQIAAENNVDTKLEKAKQRVAALEKQKAVKTAKHVA